MPKHFHKHTETPSVWYRIRNFEFVLLSDKELFKVGLILALLVAALLWMLFSWIEPPPPKRVVMTTGGQTGAYFAYANKYAAEFKKQGITLDVQASKGSVENLARLNDPKSGVSIGLVQSGIGDAEAQPELESLASVAYEPIWIFYKPTAGESPITTLKPFRGKRIAIGPEGSGARVAALKIFKLNEIEVSNSQFSELAGSDAVAAVLAGSLEAALVVASDRKSVV